MSLYHWIIASILIGQYVTASLINKLQYPLLSIINSFLTFVTAKEVSWTLIKQVDIMNETPCISPVQHSDDNVSYSLEAGEKLTHSVISPFV